MARCRELAPQAEAPRRARPSPWGVLGLQEWPSRAFRQHVDECEPEPGDTEAVLRSFDDEGVSKYADEIEDLELDSVERQQKLCTVYSLASDVYRDVNTALREDDEEALERLGPFIKELRSVFLTDHVNQVITPFEGTVYRGVGFDDPEEALRQYEREREFAWPAFSSTSLDDSVASGFGSGSGLVFEIRCYPPAGTYDDDRPEYAPASITAWSAFGEAEQEILFPPHVKFRVVNVKHPTEENGLDNPIVQCETLGFESVWEMVRSDNVEGVQRWIKHNPGRVDTQDCRHHLLDDVASDEEDSDESESTEEEGTPGVRAREFKLPKRDNVASVLRAAGARRAAKGRQKRSSKPGCLTC